MTKDCIEQAFRMIADDIEEQNWNLFVKISTNNEKFVTTQENLYELNYDYEKEEKLRSFNEVRNDYLNFLVFDYQRKPVGFAYVDIKSIQSIEMIKVLQS